MGREQAIQRVNHMGKNSLKGNSGGKFKQFEIEVWNVRRYKNLWLLTSKIYLQRL